LIIAYFSSASKVEHSFRCAPDGMRQSRKADSEERPYLKPEEVAKIIAEAKEPYKTTFGLAWAKPILEQKDIAAKYRAAEVSDDKVIKAECLFRPLYRQPLAM
jgi:hypothetical protein